MAKDTTRRNRKRSAKKGSFLESAAQAIGSTLGDLALKAGIAKPARGRKPSQRSSSHAPRTATRRSVKGVAVKPAGKGR